MHLILNKTSSERRNTKTLPDVDKFPLPVQPVIQSRHLKCKELEDQANEILMSLSPSTINLYNLKKGEYDMCLNNQII